MPELTYDEEKLLYWLRVLGGAAGFGVLVDRLDWPYRKVVAVGDGLVDRQLIASAHDWKSGGEYYHLSEEPSRRNEECL